MRSPKVHLSLEIVCHYVLALHLYSDGQRMEHLYSSKSTISVIKNHLSKSKNYHLTNLRSDKTRI